MSCVTCQELHITSNLSGVRCNLQNSFMAKPLELGSWNFYKRSTSPNLSCVMCHVLQVWCHMWCVMSFVNMWVLTLDSWHLKPDTWHVSCDRLGEVDLLSKLQLPSSNGLPVKVLWRWHMTHERWHVKLDKWHVTLDIGHATSDLWQFEGGGPTVKISASYLKRFDSEGVWRSHILCSQPTYSDQGGEADFPYRGKNKKLKFRHLQVFHDTYNCTRVSPRPKK